MVDGDDHSSSAPQLTTASLVVVMTGLEATHALEAPRLHYGGY